MARTKNRHERFVIDGLESEGYSVLKRGWPDLVAIKGDTIRFIEVKPKTTFNGELSRSQFRPDQVKMAEILSKFGITVELVRGL